MVVPNFIKTITNELKDKPPMQMAVPEGYPLLRAIQFSVAYGNNL